ncbi:hypothetical protein RND81_04G014500 [Saponaria officinalis]|uniref:rRNA N-glycosylase n=2 Tax=Saponaria officinalis TaxID=3572 RepID=A0AAW1LGP7_SAPOF
MKIYVEATIAWILLQSSIWTGNAAITLDLEEYHPKVYEDFIRKIRNNVKDPELIYGGVTDVPVMRSPVVGDKHLRINLKTDQGTVSLALDRLTLYAYAYLAADRSNVYHAYYFNRRISTKEVRNIFPEVSNANVIKINYGSDYGTLQRRAELHDQLQLGLGIQLLKQTLSRVNRRARTEKNEATFLLIAFQMVVEAARFKLIEDLVLYHYPLDFRTNNDRMVISLVDNWIGISFAVYEDAHNGVFKRPYNFGFGNVRQVKDLQLGLLLNVGK